jgi:hypothetical protein
MLPFNLETLQEIPGDLTKLVANMIKNLQIKKGIAFLTLDGKMVLKGDSQRRAGVHIDGNYLASSWGSSDEGWGGGTEGNAGGGNGWKVGEGGRIISSTEHKASYKSTTGGMLIASTYPACRGWNGKFEGDAYIGGDCTRILGLDEGFLLKKNTVYYGNSQFLHESLPVEKDVFRIIARITLPADYQLIS